MGYFYNIMEGSIVLIKKRTVAFILIILILGLVGCDNKMHSDEESSSQSNSNIESSEQNEQVESLDQNEQDEDLVWYSSYDLETDKITIAIADHSSDQPHSKLKDIVEITDANNIKLITEAIDFPSWEKVLPENEIPAEPYFYIIISDSIMIQLLSDTAYGGVREYTVKDGLYIGGDYSGDYNIPKALLKRMWQFVEPYSQQLDIKEFNFNE